MKLFFYLLLLLNVTFFLLEIGFRGDSGDSYRELAMPSAVERIVLVEEPAATTDPAEAAETDAEVPDVSPQAMELEAAQPDELPAPEAKIEWPPKVVDCFQIGPSQTREEADLRWQLLRSNAPEASVETWPGDVPDGWWLVFPKAASLDAARENRRMLAAKGVLDSWVFDKGPLQWAISLGLYQERGAAEAAQKPLMEKNIVTEVVPRMVRGKVYWLKIPWHRPALDLEEIVQVLNTQDPALRIPAPIVCD